MSKYIVYVLLIANLLTVIDAQAKRPRRIKRPKNEEDSTPQPSVVSYSTFGFNDVGSYDGFVPTSPDYANYLSSSNQEASTRLYAPAFPSAADATGFNSNFEQFDGFANNDDNEPQSSMLQYPQSSVNFFNTPSFDNSDHQSKSMASNEAPPNTEEVNGPIYGTKINSKGKRPMNSYNNTEFSVYSSGPIFNSNDMAGRFNQQESQFTHDSKINIGESVNNDQVIPSYIPNYPSADNEELVKESSNPHNAIKFPRVVDFTKVKQFYPTELDNKYQVATYSSILTNQNENMFTNDNGNQMNKFIQPTQTLKESSPFNVNHVDGDSEKENTNPNIFSNSDYSSNYIKPMSKPGFKSSHSNSDIKDNYKHKWSSDNGDMDSKNLRNPFRGYEYSTDYSNTSFKYEYTPDRKPFSSDTNEPVPASSNIDLTSYNFPDNDFSNFKKIPEVKIPFDDDFDSVQPSRNKFKSEEFLNQFKNLYTTTPSTTSQWGDAFKSSDFSYKHRLKRPHYEDGITSDIVHIPKRPFSYNKYNYGKNLDGKQNDYAKQRPYKQKFEKPRDWSKEVLNTRFKSEEDLLDLRNHDTSHPSYLPSQRPHGNDLFDETDYKKIVEKWRQSYLKSKYRDAHRDYESYASSETKPLHVPIPKPYPIEVPHPVIVPVPQPYPVRIPVPKPVAVPVIRELTVPIEKPVPYPVIKKVPYPVEKLVPVRVEKEVKVPVIKPYPVHIPHVRPVFHHSRPPREDFDSGIDDDDYLPRPESNKKIPPYKKRPKSTRGRPRRPTRMTYPDRSTSRRRTPPAHRPSETRPRRPSSKEYHAPYRHREFEEERDYENDNSDYYAYCKRTGTC